MFKPRFTIFLMTALTLLLAGIAVAQDAGQFLILNAQYGNERNHCLLYTSPSPRDGLLSRMPSSA